MKGKIPKRINPVPEEKIVSGPVHKDQILLDRKFAAEQLKKGNIK